MPEPYDPRVDRLRVMKEIYAETGDNTELLVGLWDIADKLELDDDRMANAVNFLEGQRLIKPLRTLAGRRTPMGTNITHHGIVQMERAEAEPTQASASYFPPLVSVINVGRDMIGSPTMVGNVNSSQHSRMGDIAIGTDSKKAIADFVTGFDAKARELVERGEQTQADVDQILAEVAVMKVQAAAPKPKKHFLTECTSSAKAILEHGAGGVVTAGLLALLALIVL